MPLRVKLMPDNRVIELNAGKTRARDLVRKLGMPEEMVVVLRNGEIVTGDETLSEDDEVVVMRAVSGG